MSLTPVLNPGEEIDINKVLGSVGTGTPLIAWKPGDPISTMIYGWEGGGKTDWAFTATQPMVLFDFENNTDAPMRRFPALEGKIRRYSYFVPMMGEKSKAVETADRFVREYHQVMDTLRQAGIKRATIILDSATQCGTLLTYAYVPLDANGKALPRAYGKRNNTYQALFARARAEGHHFITTCRAAWDWGDSSKLSTFHADCIDSTPFDVSTQIEVTTNPVFENGVSNPNRRFKIRRCKINPKLEGQEFPVLTFGDLVKSIEVFK